MATSKTPKGSVKILEDYALSLCGTMRGVDDEIQLIAGKWPEIFDISHNPTCIARIPVRKKRLLELSSKHPEVVNSNWVPRNGHVYMNVSLEGSVSVEEIKSWIDEGYRLVLDKLKPAERFLVMMGGRPYNEEDAIQELIRYYDLDELKSEILQVSRTAILLRTSKCAEKNIPLGASKIGGNPDLPASAVWPTHTSGRPLAFLAQINLQDLRMLGRPFDRFPTAGLLSLYSVWGWMLPDDADPQIPDGPESSDWTQCIHTGTEGPLERRKQPKGTHRSKPAPVTPILIRSFPSDLSEPSIKMQTWTAKQKKRYLEFYCAFTDLQIRALAPNQLGSWHQLGGYGRFQQTPPELIRSGEYELFLQLGSDDWASDMMWGDAGELSFLLKSDSFQKGQFNEFSAELQCG